MGRLRVFFNLLGALPGAPWDGECSALGGLSDSHATAVRAASLKEIPGGRRVTSAFSHIPSLHLLTPDS